METKLTPLYIKTFAEKFDFQTIFFLDLKSRAIVSLGAIAECKNLQTLDLSRNMI
jgi:Leucine-rich repeat (LRR) protein